MNLVLLENRQLHFKCDLEEKGELRFLADLFQKKTTVGLLALLNLTNLYQSNLDLTFWRYFTSLVFKEFCLFCDQLDSLKPYDKFLSEVLHKAPLITGYEYLNLEFLKALQWEILDTLKEEIKPYSDPRSYLEKVYPDWQNVGRVYFHLAENPKEESSDFVFLASYTTKVNQKHRLQHVTFGQALGESLSNKNNDQALKLLEPIKKAAKTSSFVKDMIQKKKIYQPSLLSRGEAHSFLQDFPIFEKEGIKVKLPQSWQGRTPQKPRVTVSLEEKSKSSHVGFHSLFQFRGQLTLGGKKLDEKEISEILESEEGLIKIRGRWLDINRDKLQSVLAYWKKAERLQQNGIPFIEAMRILAKSFLTSDFSSNKPQQETEDYLQVEILGKFKDLLESLKNPYQLKVESLNHILKKHLKAILRPYQFEGVKWLCFLKDRGFGGCLCDDMGLGKTIQVISVLIRDKYLVSKKIDQIPTSLLVAPASLLGNWKSEIDRFAPSLKVKVLHNFEMSKAQISDLAANYKEQDLLITSYKMVEKINWLFNRKWNFFILDEAQGIKNPESIQSKTIKKIDSHCRVALTGTPIENNILDLWSLFDFCLPGLLGSLAHFKNFYKSMEQKESFVPLKKIIKPYILRRLKTDSFIINDLPDKIEKKTYCLLSQEQVILYKKTLSNLSADLKLEQADIKRKGLVLSYLLKFKQICNHPSQFLSDGDYDETKSGKFYQLKKLAMKIAVCNEKLLVFTQFKEITDILDGFLNKIFQTEGFVLHGGVGVKKRKELVDLFQTKNQYPYFILSLKAGGSGLNLTRANHVIHFDRWWNPAVEMQASDRSFRIGQKKNVIVHKFITKGTLEEKIDLMITEKTKLVNDIIEPSSFKPTEFSDSEILNLMSLDLPREERT